MLTLPYGDLFPGDADPAVRLQAICSLVMLTYIHVAFSHLPNHCLDRVKEDWPREGILRVEIIRNPGMSGAGWSDVTRTGDTEG